MDAGAAVEHFAQLIGDEYELVGSLAGGETGATEIRRADGRRFVLKWTDAPDSIRRRCEGLAISERWRRAGAAWVPPTISVADREWHFFRQDLMDGRPVDRITDRLVDDVLIAHDLCLGRREPGDDDRWSDDLIQTLTVGGTNYCLHEPLRRHSGRARTLVERVEAFGATIPPGELDGDDLVHWDLHIGNLLEHADGGLAAIVDLDFAKAGDARFDLVALAVSSLSARCDEGVRRRLFGVAFDGLSDVRRLAYVGHLLIRFLDWPIRKQRADEVELWLDSADRLLDGLP